MKQKNKKQSVANNIEYVDELHALIEEVKRIVERFSIRGYIPTFNVKSGIIGMVAMYRQNPTNGTGRVGRPPKCPLMESAPVNILSDESEARA